MNSTATAPSAEMAQWSELVARYDQALQACLDGQQDLPEDDLEQLGNEVAECFSQLMCMPAPSPSALRWKIEQLLHTSDQDRHTDSWSADLVAQTLADARSMLSQQ